MKKKEQYTLRNIPPRVDQRLRERAAQYGTSLNTAALEALSRGLGLGEEVVVHRDLDDLAGTWVADPEFDKAMQMMDRVDPDLWK
ncbi:MAG: hypothetical protein KA248_02855 [Kiritimatiellae bacterium]|nr:hypothetical protein [Kiritimatiellia bacterium]